jgi:hypothetical protein
VHKHLRPWHVYNIGLDDLALGAPYPEDLLVLAGYRLDDVRVKRNGRIFHILEKIFHSETICCESVYIQSLSLVMEDGKRFSSEWVYFLFWYVRYLGKNKINFPSTLDFS